MPTLCERPEPTACVGELGSGSMSVKRHLALIHALGRAVYYLRKGDIARALTSLELGLLIAKELLARALKYQERDMAVKESK